MELVQDGTQLCLALIALSLSAGLAEWSVKRIKGGVGAVCGILIAFVCTFIISEFGAWVGAAYQHVPHITGYGRIFSFAAFGLILYVPVRIYQLMRVRSGQEPPEQTTRG